MIGIVVVTKMEVSTHLINAAQLVTGPQENLIAVNLVRDEALQDQSKNVMEAVHQCMKNPVEPVEGILVLIDLYGSTAMNASMFEIESVDRPIEVLTGVNLPMVVSALFNRGRLGLKELAQKVMIDAQKGIKDVKATLLASKKPSRTDNP